MILQREKCSVAKVYNVYFILCDFSFFLTVFIFISIYDYTTAYRDKKYCKSILRRRWSEKDVLYESHGSP